jgi:DNA-directed RNA polymerase subunit N (RpoN/RPB10)
MRINCLACGHKVDLDDAYDDYEGPVKCFACRAILEIRTEQGSIKAVKQVNSIQHPSAEEVFERVLNPTNATAQGAGTAGPRRIG